MIQVFRVTLTEGTWVVSGPVSPERGGSGLADVLNAIDERYEVFGISEEGVEDYRVFTRRRA